MNNGLDRNGKSSLLCLITVLLLCSVLLIVGAAALHEKRVEAYELEECLVQQQEELRILKMQEERLFSETTIRARSRELGMCEGALIQADVVYVPDLAVSQ